MPKDSERMNTGDQGAEAKVTGWKCLWLAVARVVGYPIAFIILFSLLARDFFSQKAWRSFRVSLTGVEGRALSLEWGESVLTAFILAMVIRTFLFQPFKIPSGSMRMTLIEGDRLFVNKLAYGPLFPFSKVRLPGFAKPRRGDVIVFRFPVTKDKDYIKRLIAFGGEMVEIRLGRVYINGNLIDQGPIAERYYFNRGDYGAQDKQIVVPDGFCFVMGDNSGSSYDSRYWGFVPENVVIGRADLVFWPLGRMGWIK